MTVELVTLKRFALTNWKGRISFSQAPVENFDGVKVLNLAMYIPTTGNETIELRCKNYPEFNVGTSQIGDQIYDYMYQTILDKRQDVAIYQENTNPVTKLINVIPQMNIFDYELTINNVAGDADFSPSNPVYVELGFFRHV
jgi:hypothetical protein